MTTTRTHDQVAALGAVPADPKQAPAPARPRTPSSRTSSKKGIRERRYGRGRAYYVDGVKFPGVTSISSLIKGYGLINYQGRQVAAAAVNRWEELSELPPADRLRALEKAAFEERDEAAARGTEVHRLGALIAHGDEVEVPEALRGYVDGYVKWLDEFDPAIVATELIVAHRPRARVPGYCGRLDLIADLGPIRPEECPVIPAGRHLIDVKTGRSGVWPETAIQLVGYASAQVYVHPESKKEVPMAALGITNTSSLWLTSDGGFEFRPVYTGAEVWDEFRDLARCWWRQDHRPEWIGTTATPLSVTAGPVP
jgi:hypothetical protein